MLVLASVAWVFLFQAVPPAPLDVTALKIGAPAVVAEIDMGKLKGEPRRLAWSSDGATIYIQTVEGNPPREKPRHYTVLLDGGRVQPVESEPAWAAEFWAVKQDRAAPGLPSLAIQVVQGQEMLKLGMAPAGALDRTGSPESTAGTISPEAGHGDQRAHVVRLLLQGQVIGTWTNERVIPGTRFSWGPAGSGSMVFVGEGGRLILFDGQKRKQTVEGVKDALLPAWSTDGARLAYLVKTGRRNYVLSWVTVSR